ncbi:MAG: hypothetical protein Q8928_14995 [Bacteroidota bacterium]|nr:hypothetical protein [Bacteroidota bacterium]
MKNNYLNLQRSFLYTRQFLTRNYITLLIGFVLAFLAGTFFVYMLLRNRSDAPFIKETIQGMLQFFFGFGLFGLGFIFTSITSNDYQSKNRKIWALTLPVSILERMFSMLLITTICYVIIYIPTFYVFKTSINAIVHSYSNVTITFDLLTEKNFKLIGQYFVLQSIFLAGAAWFHKNSFIKTGLIVIVFIMILFWIDYQFHKHVFAVYPDTHYSPVFELFTNNNNTFQLPENTFSTIQLLSQIFFYALLAPLFWTITYLRLKEEEV